LLLGLLVNLAHLELLVNLELQYLHLVLPEPLELLGLLVVLKHQHYHLELREHLVLLEHLVNLGLPY
jgi:hypothetical protein